MRAVGDQSASIPAEGNEQAWKEHLKYRGHPLRTIFCGLLALMVFPDEEASCGTVASGGDSFPILPYGQYGLEHGRSEYVCGDHILMEGELGAVLDSGF